MRRVLTFVVLTVLVSPAWAQPGPDYVATDPHVEEKPKPPAPAKDYPAWRRSWTPEGLELVAFSVVGSGVVTWADGYEIAEPGDDDLPDALGESGLRLHEVAWGAGGGGRFLYQSTHGVRFGSGVSAYALMGHTLEHDALPSGVTLRLDEVTMLGAELALGKAFDAGDVLPYVDLVGHLNIVLTRIENSVAPVGTAGYTDLQSLDFTLAPRLGLFIPLNEDFFIDVAVYGGLFGLERAGANLTLGYFDML